MGWRCETGLENTRYAHIIFQENFYFLMQLTRNYWIFVHTVSTDPHLRLAFYSVVKSLITAERLKPRRGWERTRWLPVSVECLLWCLSVGLWRCDPLSSTQDYVVSMSVYFHHLFWRLERCIFTVSFALCDSQSIVHTCAFCRNVRGSGVDEMAHSLGERASRLWFPSFSLSLRVHTWSTT